MAGFWTSPFGAWCKMACVLGAVLGGQSARADEIKLVGEAYCPFTCAGDMPGFLTEVIEEIFASNGYVITYKNIPWSRALLLVKSGKVDGVIGIVKNSEPDLVYPNEPLGDLRPCYFTSVDNQWEYTGVKSLQTEKLGFVKDYGYKDDLKEFIAANPDSVESISANNSAIFQLLKLLHRGRISTFTEDVSVVQFALKREGHFKVKMAGCDPGTLNLHIGFSPSIGEASGYARIIDEGIVKLRSSGRYQQILSKYGISDWEQVP